MTDYSHAPVSKMTAAEATTLVREMYLSDADEDLIGLSDLRAALRGECAASNHMDDLVARLDAANNTRALRSLRLAMRAVARLESAKAVLGL
jgi:hypothetical protein